MQNTNQKLVPGVGPKNAQVVLVGEAPGANEEIEGLPFVGKSGTYINKWLKELNLNREQVYITNLMKVRPENNRDPLPEEVEYWKPILVQELTTINAPVIIPIGSFAARTILDTKETITNLRGMSHYTSEFGKFSIVIPIYHPSYIMKNPSKEALVIQDLAYIKGILEGLK